MADWKGQDIDSWDEFERCLHSLNALKATVSERSPSKLLFRGQKVADWDLKTSLDREFEQPLKLNEYFRAIKKTQPEIESQTGLRWETVPDYPGYQSWLQSLDQGAVTPVLLDLPGYEYLAYLRHHGFPSPFLDWSRSPYIAAYFAFADAEARLDNQVSIYVYWEDVGRGKTCPPRDKPFICTKGPYVRTHRRHFLQQSQYSFCVQQIDGAWQFASHDSALTRCDGMTDNELKASLADGSQDLAWKFNLPASEKWNVLRYLDDHNINGFSLYGSEESLMKTVAIREMHLGSRSCPSTSKVGTDEVD